jgi:oxygen-independent coproporphyrinogen-3 oxidase
VNGVYVHVPFCVHRCHYCDFFTIAGRDDERGDFVDRLLGEAAAVLPRLPSGIETIFIGGGTPTHLPTGDLQRLLVGLGELLAAGAPPLREWTIEANPDTITPQIAAVLAGSGVTRVSLGAQSFDPVSLATLERQHEPRNVGFAVDHLRAAGIEDVSLDLIFGIPGQAAPLDVWKRDLDHAIAVRPTHLSCYGLTYEAGTPLRRRLDRGQVARVSEDTEAALYEHTLTHLAAAGFEHYEISNWALPGNRCKHNLGYWRNANWWPLGPGGSGHVDGRRWRNVPRLGPWFLADGLPAIDSYEHRSRDDRLGEALMLGLRLSEGVPRELVDEAMAAPDRGSGRGAALERHQADGLIAWREDRLALTHRGRLLADTVIGDLL